MDHIFAKAPQFTRDPLGVSHSVLNQINIYKMISAFDLLQDSYPLMQGPC